jgi:hypothetical protein
MAEERALGLATGQTSEHEESKEELQRQLEQTRNSISSTMSEIKDTVAHQVQAVKDTFDWREQFKKRPVVWSVGALGVGFMTGYKLADTFKHPSTPTYFSPEQYSYSPQKRINEGELERDVSWSAEDRDQGPGLVDRLKGSPMYNKVSNEASSLGNELVSEVSSAARTILVPFLLMKFKEFVGLDRIEKSQSQLRSETKRPAMGRTDWSEPERSPRPESTLGHS